MRTKETPKILNYLQDHELQSNDLLIGIYSGRKLPNDPLLSVPELLSTFKISKSKLKCLLVLGMLSYFQENEILYFRESIAEREIEFAKVYWTFKTDQEKMAFLIGAQQCFPHLNLSIHYCFRKGLNKYWFNQITHL